MVTRRAFVMLGVAILVALTATILIYNWLERKVVAKKVAIETQPVVIAAVDIPWGMRVTRDMVKKVDFAKGYLSGGFFSDPSMLEGRVLIYPVKANEPIFESRLAPTGIKAGGVAALVDSRKRAFFVKVDRTTLVSGFIHPGNRVDVLVTLTSGKGYPSVTKTILENIRVLAVGQEMGEKNGSGAKHASADVITLEVSPEEAEKLGLAVSEGKIILALRNFYDTESVLTKGVQINALLASYSPNTRTVGGSVAGKDDKRKKQESEGQKPRVFTVQVIKGKEVGYEKFEVSENRNKAE